MERENVNREGLDMRENSKQNSMSGENLASSCTIVLSGLEEKAEETQLELDNIAARPGISCRGRQSNSKEIREWKWFSRKEGC